MLHSLIAIDDLLEMTAHAAATPNGSFVEVGVYQGGSAYWLYKVAMTQKRNLYLYDTFNGIPYRDEIDSHEIGDFKDTNIDYVRAMMPEATIVSGVFPESATLMTPIAFAHIDCDQYRAVKESASYLHTKMVHGGIMWFDDYGSLNGATQAINEFFSPKSITRVGSGKAMVRF